MHCFYINDISVFIIKQMINPVIVGNKNANMVHNLLFVSFLIVKIVVLQGKWNNIKIKVQIAVVIVQPLFINNVFNSNKLP